MTNEVDPKQKHIADTPGGASQDFYEESEGLGILDLIIILAERKCLILISVLVCGLLAGIIAFTTPPTFTATAVIMPPQQQSSSAAALLGQLGGLGGIASQSLGIRNSADLYIGILGSRTVADALIAQFKLVDVYKAKNSSSARTRLKGATTFKSAKSSLIEISVVDRDKKRAADLANAYVSQLQEQNSRLALTESSQRRLFFEQQLDVEKNKLAEAEAAFKTMQEQKGIFQVSSQVAAVISSMAQMRAELAAREVILQRLKAGATAQNPEVLRQEIEIKALRGQLRELETNSTRRRQGDPLMPTTLVPEASLEYARLLREVKYRETLYELLAKQYEAARIDEAKESPIIQVVDDAIPPDRKSAPAKKNYMIVGVLLGGMFGIVAALLMQAAENSKRASKIVVLKKSLLFWSKE